MSRRPLRGFWLVAALVLLALLAAVEPTHIVRGLLRGEHFFDGRPTGYWRNVLRDDSLTGRVSYGTAQRLDRDHRAIPVLLDCLRDSDSEVRKPAAMLLARCEPVADIVAALTSALRDPDPEVAVRAAGALGALGPAARSAAPELSELTHGTDGQIARAAEDALWRIDVPAALRAGSWTRFDSPAWGFSAEFAGTPKQSEPRPTDTQPSPARWFSAARLGTRFVVGVSEYPTAPADESEAETRFNRLRDLMPSGLGGRLVSERPVRSGSAPGRELLIHTDVGLIRLRLFWSGRRLYQVNVHYDPNTVIAPAAEYFLNSFRLLPPRPAV